uniref:MFS transporter n=1 Tax=Streptomyces neyagawaensis TaxID=42238 RepID=UPI000B154419
PLTRTAPSAPDRPQSLLRDIADGLRWTWRQRFLRVLLVTAAGFGLVFSALTFTAIVAARQSGATPADVGLMMAISGVGGLLGALAAPRLQRRSPTSVVLAMFWVAAAAIPAMAVRPTAWTIGPLLAAAFFLAPAANAILYTYQMTITPDHLQGRVLSSLALIGGAVAPVGPLASGLVLEHWGVRAALLAIASVMGLVALGATWSRTVRHLPPLDRARAVG